MNKNFSRIKYFDAKYSKVKTENVSEFEPDLHICYGVLNNIDKMNSRIDFVIADGSVDKNYIHYGVVLPTDLVKSTLVKPDKRIASNVDMLEQKLAVRWADVTVIKNGKMVPPSEMLSIGKMIYENDNCIVLENVITERVSPNDSMPHPEGLVKLYVIPKAAILNLNKHE